MILKTAGLLLTLGLVMGVAGCERNAGTAAAANPGGASAGTATAGNPNAAGSAASREAGEGAKDVHRNGKDDDDD